MNLLSLKTLAMSLFILTLFCTSQVYKATILPILDTFLTWTENEPMIKF